MADACVVVDTTILYFHLLEQLRQAAAGSIPGYLITPQFRALTVEQRAEIASYLGGAEVVTVPGVIAEVDRRWRVFKPFYGKCPRCGHSEPFRAIGGPERRAFREELHKLVLHLQLKEELVVVRQIPLEHFVGYGPVDGALFALAVALQRQSKVLVVTADDGLRKECVRAGLEAVHVKAPIE